MTDGQLLFLIMALIYVGECLVWLPKGALACLKGMGSRARLKSAPSNFSSSKGGWVLASPFPPLGKVFVTRPLPVCLDENRFVIFTIESPNPGYRPEASSGIGFEWDEIERITRDGKKILVNGNLLLKESSPEAAFRLAEFLREIWKAEKSQRRSLIASQLERSFNESRVARLIRFWERKTISLRFWCNILLLLLFGGIPACLIFYGPSLELLTCGLAALGTMFLIAFRFLALYKRCYPGLGFDRWQWFFLILLVPQQSMRAHDLLLKGVTAEFHPLAVADIALPEESERRQETLGSLYRDLCFPLKWDSQLATKEFETVSGYYRDFLFPAVEKFGIRKGDEEKRWLEPVREEGEISYCPRCSERFLSEEVTHCHDCDGIPVQAFQA